MPLKESGALGAVEFKPPSVLGDVGCDLSGSHGRGGVSRCAGGCGQCWRGEGFGAEEQPEIARAMAANAIGVSKVFRFRCIQLPLGFCKFCADGIASFNFGEQVLMRLFGGV